MSSVIRHVRTEPQFRQSILTNRNFSHHSVQSGLDRRVHAQPFRRTPCRVGSSILIRPADAVSNGETGNLPLRVPTRSSWRFPRPTA